MVRKLFSRPRSKTAGAASISYPVLHCVDTLPRPDLLPVGNVTTDISAGHNTNHQNQNQQPQPQPQPSRTPNRTRLHFQHGGEKQQPPPLPSNTFAKRADVLTPPSSSERKPHKLQKQHRPRAESHNHNLANGPRAASVPYNPQGAAQAAPISHPNNGSNSDQKSVRDEKDSTPEHNPGQATLKRRQSKWRKMGSLLKSKDVYRDAPPLPPEAQEVCAHEPPVTSQPQHTARTTSRPPPTTKTTTFRSMLTHAPSPAPKLSLEMPDIHMERYSVMFNRVLPSSPEGHSPNTRGTPTQQRRPSALLNRREKKLQGLNLQAPSRAYSTDNLLQPGRPTDRHTPSANSGRTLNVPRTACSVEPGKSPLRRSNTAPPSPIKDGQFLSVSKHDASAATPSSVSGSSILTRRRRSLDSIASPGFVDTDTSDGDDCDADDDDDAIIVHAKAPVWEDPHEPKWEIINPRRKAVKPVVKQEAPSRGRDCSRQSSGHTPRPSTASAAETKPKVSLDESTTINAAGITKSVDDSVIMKRSSGENDKDLSKTVDSTPVHPALVRLSRNIPPIPPKSPARSSTTSTTSLYHSAQTSPVMAARKTSLPCLLSEQSLPSPVIPVSNLQQHHQPHFPFVPSALSSNVTYEGHSEPDDFTLFEPDAVEVSVARSVSVSRKARQGQPGPTNGVTFSGRGQLVRSRSRSAGAGPRRLHCAS